MAEAQSTYQWQITVQRMVEGPDGQTRNENRTLYGNDDLTLAEACREVFLMTRFAEGCHIPIDAISIRDTAIKVPEAVLTEVDETP